jgi:hypothetical protein
MDGFLDKEGRKVSASHDTSNYYPPSSESASLSHTAFGAQVGGGMHCQFLVVGMVLPFSVNT